MVSRWGARRGCRPSPAPPQPDPTHKQRVMGRGRGGGRARRSRHRILAPTPCNVSMHPSCCHLAFGVRGAAGSGDMGTAGARRRAALPLRSSPTAPTGAISLPALLVLRLPHLRPVDSSCRRASAPQWGQQPGGAGHVPWERPRTAPGADETPTAGESRHPGASSAAATHSSASLRIIFNYWV